MDEDTANAERIFFDSLSKLRNNDDEDEDAGAVCLVPSPLPRSPRNMYGMIAADIPVPETVRIIGKFTSENTEPPYRALTPGFAD